jgi:hypothetical protein
MLPAKGPGKQGPVLSKPGETILPRKLRRKTHRSNGPSFSQEGSATLISNSDNLCNACGAGLRGGGTGREPEAGTAGPIKLRGEEGNNASSSSSRSYDDDDGTSAEAQSTRGRKASHWRRYRRCVIAVAWARPQ